MKKILYIIPGYGESTAIGGYPEIIAHAAKKGYEVIPFNPKWSRSIMSQWVENFLALAEQHDAKNISILGFSLGASISVLSASKLNFREIISCSLSPFFKEDIAELSPKARKTASDYLGKRRMADFKKYSFPSHLKTPIHFLVGSKETDYTDLVKKVKEYYFAWQGPKTLHVVQEARHDISGSEYLRKIKDILK